MPQITSSAEQAARRIVDGGHLWVAGSQPDFAVEATGRAGGLMMVHPAGEVARGDVVLVGTRGPVNDDDRASIARWKQAGAYVVVFTADARRANADATITSISGAGPGAERYPTDTVQNLVNLWTWTGEFAAACTRLGKMPVFFQTYGLPGGRERAKKYLNQPFHDDRTIAPIAAGVLGNAYLKAIDQMLLQIESGERSGLEQAGRWLAHAGPSGSALRTQGHIWPAHAEDPRAAHPFASALNEEKPLPEQVSFVLHLSYQTPPNRLIQRAREGAFELVYCSVERGRNDEAGNIIYINPRWPMADACVDVAGYDIPILPASGVVQSCIYWSIVQDAGSSAPAPAQ